MKHILEEKDKANALLDNATALDTIHNKLSWEYNENKKVDIIDSLWEDSGLESWIKAQPRTYGGSMYIWDIVKRPTYDIELLQKRQSAIDTLPTTVDTDLKLLATFEKDVAWLFTLPPLKEAYPINILFPMVPVLNSINKFPYFLTLFHIYRISIMPWFNLLSPIMTILSPWFYLKKLKIEMSLKSYLSIMWKGVLLGLSGFGGKKKFSRIVSIIIYIALYIYGIIQSFEMASMLYTIRNNLNEKMENIRRFISIGQNLIRSIPEESIKAYSHNYTTRKELILPSGLAGLYSIMTEKPLQGTLLSIMRGVYAIDVCSVINRLRHTRQCCVVSYNSNRSTKMWNMGHIILQDTQVKNPVSLTHSLIITGPNAAGKSTYVRGICTNYILAQTFGIASALKANINPVHAIGSFIRISDELGKLSLFEAEAKRCAELIKQAEEISRSGKTAIYFLDEPMHSTPPIEGTATSIAVIEHIGNLPGIKLLVTTHYHDIIKLGDDKLFKNISVEANIIENDIVNCSYKYNFPYKIKSGHSRQCIALELLSDKNLPKKIIKRAIEVKNKIYPIILN